ncbi:MAG: hypothetical protein Q9202_002697 [Teloschistes flavicans]
MGFRKHLSDALSSFREDWDGPRRPTPPTHRPYRRHSGHPARRRPPRQPHHNDDRDRDHHHQHHHHFSPEDDAHRRETEQREDERRRTEVKMAYELGKSRTAEKAVGQEEGYQFGYGDGAMRERYLRFEGQQAGGGKQKQQERYVDPYEESYDDADSYGGAERYGGRGGGGGGGRQG